MASWQHCRDHDRQPSNGWRLWTVLEGNCQFDVRGWLLIRLSSDKIATNACVAPTSERCGKLSWVWLMTCRASPVAATIKVRKHIASSRNVPQRATIDSSAMFPLLHAWLAQSTGPHSLVRPAPRAFPCPDRNSRAIARSSGQGWQQWLQSLAARPVGRLPQQDQCLPDCLAIKPAAGSRGVTGICAPQPQHALRALR